MLIRAIHYNKKGYNKKGLAFFRGIGYNIGITQSVCGAWSIMIGGI